jgi:hypothetical protein
VPAFVSAGCQYLGGDFDKSALARVIVSARLQTYHVYLGTETEQAFRGETTEPTFPAAGPKLNARDTYLEALHLHDRREVPQRPRPQAAIDWTDLRNNRDPFVEAKPR